MPRKPRKILDTNFVHIVVQGINKEYIFKDEKEILSYITLMYKVNTKYNIEIIAYCIMNNHAHLLLKFNKINELSSYMHWINTQYAKLYNSIHECVGYVFRDRFKSEGIYGEIHLNNCIAYIFNNPVKAGICRLPEDYKYSNISDFIGYKEYVPDGYEFIDDDVK